jgi:anti-sigma factor RsiW
VNDELHPCDELSALLDGELPDDVAEQVYVHCLVCSACAADLDAARHARRELRELPAVEPPPGFLDALMYSWSPLPPSGRAPGQRTGWWVGNAAAAVVVGLALVVSASGHAATADAAPAAVGAAVQRHAATISAVSAGVDTVIDGPPAATSLAKPYVAPTDLVGYRLVNAYDTSDGVQLLYEKGSDGLSVFESTGSARHDATTIAGHPVEIVTHDGLVLTVVGGSADAVHAAAQALAGHQPLTTRVRRACGEVVAGLSPTG